MSHWAPGAHTSTFMGNAVNLAAGRAAIGVLRDESAGRAIGGARARPLLERLAARSPTTPACRRDPRTRPVRRHRDRRPIRRPRDARPGPRARRSGGGLRARRRPRRRRPRRERHQALPAADHRRRTARRRRSTSPSTPSRGPDDPDHRPSSPSRTTSTAAWRRPRRRDLREPRPGDRRPGRDRAAVGRRGRGPGDRRRPPTFDDGAWPATSGRERAAILLELARLLREEAEPLAAARRDRDGQADPLRPRARDRAGHRPDPVLRQRRPDDPRRGDGLGPEPPPQLHPQGAGRRVRAHHAVERPGRPAAAQDRRGDRDRLHVRAQAGQRRPGVVDGDLRAARPDRGPAERRRERGRRARARSSARRSRPIRGSTRSASPAAARSAGG